MVDQDTHNPLLPLRQHQVVIPTKETRRNFATTRYVKVQEKNDGQLDICRLEINHPRRKRRGF
jgi:hypothetical protein